MAYELHIERPAGEISLAEWCSAVQATAGMRLATEDAVAVNPATREEIRIRRAEGDTEVLLESGGFLGLGRKQQWVRAFRFTHGRASFRASASIESPADSVHRAAVRLAASLGAKIVGDGGETYEW